MSILSPSFSWWSVDDDNDYVDDDGDEMIKMVLCFCLDHICWPVYHCFYLSNDGKGCGKFCAASLVDDDPP